MPGVIPPVSTYFLHTLDELNKRVRALETQQQQIFVDNTLTAQAIAGNLVTDNVGNPTGLGATWGFAVRVGGKWVAFDNVLNPQYAQAVGSVTTSSATAVDLGGPSTPNVLVGPSGNVLATMGAFIEPNAGNLTGGVIMAVDGATWGGSIPMEFSCLPAGAPTAAGTTSLTQLLTGITPGIHTFSMWYFSTAASCSFVLRTLAVQPF